MPISARRRNQHIGSTLNWTQKARQIPGIARLGGLTLVPNIQRLEVDNCRSVPHSALTTGWLTLGSRTSLSATHAFERSLVMRIRNLGIWGVTALLVLLLASAAVVTAQETTGTIRGRIVDSQSLGVPGVTVTVT